MARGRAHKELAHLSNERIIGSTPEKAWDFAMAASEMQPILALFTQSAATDRLSPNVAGAIR